MNKDEDFEDLCVSLFYDHYLSNISYLHHSWFDEDMFENVKELVDATLEGGVSEEVFCKAYDIFRIMYPCRTSWFAPVVTSDFASVLELLRTQPKHAQRTPEWYETRHNLITASSAYKMFGTVSEQNSLIVEKCAEEKERPPLSLYDARHWGVRYEPVSTMYYEHTRKTVVEEFGCLVHPTLRFLGASPDGINVDSGTEVYGRMLEIKNPVSRVITGVPTTEYWIQMQLQMEVCNIDLCDFLETQFVEYEDVDAFRSDGSFLESAEGKCKGLILLFFKEGKNIYEYAPYGECEEAVVAWETQQKTVEDREYVKTIYWRLNEVSCVLVERNKKWFDCHKENMGEFWKTVCTERENKEWIKRIPLKKKPTW
jgi:putative phage-type endonuclease